MVSTFYIFDPGFAEILKVLIKKTLSRVGDIAVKSDIMLRSRKITLWRTIKTTLENST